MFDNHDNLTAKHLGITRIYERIRKKYFWIEMYNDVKKWVKKWHNCNAKKGSPLNRMEFTEFIASTKPFEIVGVDYMVQLPTLKKENKNIIVIVIYLLNG